MPAASSRRRVLVVGGGPAAECVAAIAKAIGAHEDTVALWIKAEFGSPRSPAADEMTAKLRAAEAECERLRQENRTLTERLAARAHRSFAAQSIGAAAL
ncbi:transposase [Rhodococcus sp. NBC_00297]|uniref:transposase n=1 Tax=Rhodococcus sp. NBC_00297 TaxID=2976005 RepID=UPI002E27F547|nr:transposase [Rhodococcus sp. NBC_00297]